MTLDWTTIESLHWFFSGAAEADAGSRSVQGGFEDTMNRLALCGRPAKGHAELREGKAVWVEGGIPVHETRAAGSRFELPIEIHRPGGLDEDPAARLLVQQVEHQVGRRTTEARSEILSRLRELTPRHRALLELQFGDEYWFVEGLVWASCRAAREHRWGVSLALLCCTSRIVQTTERINAGRAKRGKDMVDARDAVALLLGRPDDDSKGTVEGMVAEACEAISEAMNAYASR